MMAINSLSVQLMLLLLVQVTVAGALRDCCLASTQGSRTP